MKAHILSKGLVLVDLPGESSHHLSDIRLNHDQDYVISTLLGETSQSVICFNAMIFSLSVILVGPLPMLEL